MLKMHNNFTIQMNIMNKQLNKKRQLFMYLCTILEQIEVLFQISYETMLQDIFKTPYALFRYFPLIKNTETQTNHQPDINTILRTDVYDKMENTENVWFLVICFQRILQENSQYCSALNCFILSHLYCLYSMLEEPTYAQRAIQKWQERFKQLNLGQHQEGMFGDYQIVQEAFRVHRNCEQGFKRLSQRYQYFLGNYGQSMHSNNQQMNGEIMHLWQQLYLRPLAILSIKQPQQIFKNLKKYLNTRQTYIYIKQYQYKPKFCYTLPRKAQDLIEQLMRQSQKNHEEETTESKTVSESYQDENQQQSLYGYQQYLKHRQEMQSYKQKEFLLKSEISEFIAEISARCQLWVLNQNVSQEFLQKLVQKYHIRRFSNFTTMKNVQLSLQYQNNNTIIAIIQQNCLKNLTKSDKFIEKTTQIYCKSTKNSFQQAQKKIKYYTQEKLLIQQLLSIQHNKEIPNLKFINQQKTQINQGRFSLNNDFGLYNQEKALKDFLNAFKAFLKIVVKEKLYPKAYNENKVEEQLALIQKSIHKDSLFWIKLYTSDTYFYRFINRCLRMTNNPMYLAHIRYGLSKVYHAIQDLFIQQKNQPWRKEKKKCYRGCYLSKQQINQLKRERGKFIQLEGVISTSFSKPAAQLFGRDMMQIILPQNISNIGNKETIGAFASVQYFSTYRYQKQIIFNPGNYFRIKDVLPSSEGSPQYIILEYIPISDICNTTKQQYKNLRQNFDYEKRAKSKIKNQGDLFYILGMFQKSHDWNIKNLAETIKNKQNYEIQDKLDIPEELIDEVSSQLKLPKQQVGNKLRKIIKNNSQILYKLGDIEYERCKTILTLKYYKDYFQLFFEKNKHNLNENFLQQPHQHKIEKIILNLSNLQQKIKELLGERLECSANLSLMGYLQIQLGNYQNAVRLFLECKKIEQKKFSKSHPEYGATLSMLAYVETKLGHYDMALQYFKQCSRIEDICVGSSHINYGSTLKKIGCLYAYKGNKNQALQNFEKCKSVQAIYLKNSFQYHHEDSTTKKLIQIVKNQDQIDRKIFLQYLDDILFSFAKIGRYTDFNEIYQEQIKWIEAKLTDDEDDIVYNSLINIVEQSYEQNLNIVALEIQNLLKLQISEKQLRKNVRNFHICIKNMRYLLRKTEKLDQIEEAKNIIEKIKKQKMSKH